MNSTQQEIELYNADLEAAILSAIIFDNEIFIDIGEKLSSDDFYIPDHKKMFEIFESLSENDEPMDEVFILPKLSKVSKSAEETLIRVMSTNPISNIDAYISMIKDLTKKRKLNDVALKIRKAIQEDKESQDILISTMDDIEDIHNVSATGYKARKMSEIVSEIESDMDKALRGEKTPFYKTGYKSFDSEIGGFFENGLTVIAGRPSMGKSSFTSGPIVKTLEDGNSAVLYSMEVEDKNALTRLISFVSQEPLSSIKNGRVTNFTDFNEARDFFKSNDDNFVIVDKSGMSRRELEMDILRRIKKDPSLKLIVVDHLLQIQIDSSKHAPTELGETTKMLKRIAQNYKITVVLLSQLNRGVESRENKRPMMADLQGSGSIEQDADMIVFLYRSEYYKEKEWDQDKNGPYEKKQVEQAEAIVGKNRDGPTGSIEISFKPRTASFMTEYMPASITEYIEDDDNFYGENHNEKASVKENDDIIDIDTSRNSSVSMPTI